MKRNRRWLSTGPNGSIWVVLSWLVVIGFAAALILLVVLTASGQQN